MLAPSDSLAVFVDAWRLLPAHFLISAAMFIAVIGTRLAGKDTVKDYLVKDKGFTYVGTLQQVSMCDRQFHL